MDQVPCKVMECRTTITSSLVTRRKSDKIPVSSMIGWVPSLKVRPWFGWSLQKRV